MKKLNQSYVVDKDIIDAVVAAGKHTGYKGEELMGYIAEYSYKRRHGIPFKVAIEGNSDGGYDFVRDGKKCDIKATFCPSEWMRPEGYTAWSLTKEKLHVDTTYILCRTNWKEGMRYAFMEECYEVDFDELDVVGAEVHMHDAVYEYMSTRSLYVVHSNRDCVVCTNQFMDVYLQKMNKVAEWDNVDYSNRTDFWMADVSYPEFRKRLVGGYNISGHNKLSELCEEDREDIFKAIKSIRDPREYFRNEREIYEDWTSRTN